MNHHFLKQLLAVAATSLCLVSVNLSAQETGGAPTPPTTTQSTPEQKPTTIQKKCPKKYQLDEATGKCKRVSKKK